jgi:hypothetical protein
MKLISWKDKYMKRRRDGEDLLLIMKKREEARNFETTLAYNHMFDASYFTPIKSVRKLENFILIGTQSRAPNLRYCKPSQKALPR